MVKAAAEMPHGGDLAVADAIFGTPADGWLDLSTGISPLAYPGTSLADRDWTALPQPSDVAALEAAARDCYAVPDAAAIVAAPGTQALIQSIPELNPRHAERACTLVVSPTYSEHALSFERQGWTVEAIADLPTELLPGVGAVVVTNPNNPDGRRWTRDRIIALADACAADGGLLVVDEAFADATAPDQSVASAAGRDGLIVLRSFGKFFGLAGLRLGFAVGPEHLISKLRTRLGPWAVSGPAITIGRRALSDRDWIAERRRDLAKLRGRLTELLSQSGFTVVGHGHLFVTVEQPHATRLHGELAARGVWIRRFAYSPQWLRFGLPGPGQFGRLSEALQRATDVVL